MNRATLDRYDKNICGTVWTSPHARRLLDTICYEFGPRHTASKGLRAAQKFVASELRKLGATNVHDEKVDALAWRPGTSHVEIVSKRPRVRRGR